MGAKKRIIAKLTNNRLIALTEEDKKQGHFVSVNALPLLEKQAMRVWVKGFDREVLFVHWTYTKNDGSKEFLNLVCNDVTIDCEKVAAYYRKQALVKKLEAKQSAITVEQHIDEKPATKTKTKTKKIRQAAAAVAVLGVVGYAAHWALSAQGTEETDDAYVQGNVVQITPQIAGTIGKIHADDTDIVEAGKPLISLDTADADVALANAEAQLAQTVREVRTLYTSQAQANANLALRNAELARAQDDYSRRIKFANSGAISKEEIHHAEHALATAKASVSVAREQLNSGNALIKGTDVAQHPNVRRSATRVYEAMLTQSRSTLYAPVGGQIVKRNAQIGQRINQSAPLMAIVPLDQLWVDANFKESQLRHLRIGQSVTLTADVYGSKIRYHGKITGLAAGTGSAFALLPAQNATGNWIKVVQRVPVRIALDKKDLLEHPLRIGLSMHAEIDIREQNGAGLGKGNAGTNPATTYTAVNHSIDTEAKQRIETIIATNLS